MFNYRVHRLILYNLLYLFAGYQLSLVRQSHSTLFINGFSRNTKVFLRLHVNYNKYSIKQEIIKQARALGFDATGFCPAQLPAETGENYSGFLAKSHHGDMEWLKERASWRANPGVLWPQARSVIMLGHNYGPESSPLEKAGKKQIGNISCYALNDDYHDIIKKKLKQLARWLVQNYPCELKVFVDTAPVMEKPLAAQAGLGWQGKHTCLVSREFGSWLFLGSIFTTLDLINPVGGEAEAPYLEPVEKDRDPPPHPPQDGCGSCTRCLDICPTQAFTAPREIDARKCISYLTIENKGQIPLEYRKAIGNRIYGCDDCLAVCPWNKFARNAQEAAYHPREALKAPLLRELVMLDDAAFRELFRKSPVKRIGRDRFIRNVLVAIGNSGDTSLLPVISGLTGDPSPLVCEMARWAAGELAQAAKS